jgi:hypothetical protein
MRPILKTMVAALAAAILLMPGRASDNSTRKATLTETEFDKLMTSISNWGRWGKDDQLGALNLITPEKRKQAAGAGSRGCFIFTGAQCDQTEAGRLTGF